MIMTGAARLMRVFRRKEEEADEGQGQLSYLGDHRFGGGGGMNEREEGGYSSGLGV